MLLAGSDLPALAARYAEDRRLRIEGALHPSRLDPLQAAVQAHTDYDLMAATRHGIAALTPVQLAGLGEEGRAQLQEQLHADAAQGHGFAYDGVRLGEDRGPALAEAFAHELKSAAVLASIAEITGHAVTGASAQLTRFRPGQFLTRHKDDPAQETRRLAYVLSLTKNWHPDQGGLLMFYTDKGEPRDAWVPKAGTLALFDVSHVHSVTVVAPFAPHPRLSITGWFSA